MIYLIGGTARVGKSTLAATILKRKNISNISFDIYPDRQRALELAYVSLFDLDL